MPVILSGWLDGFCRAVNFPESDLTKCLVSRKTMDLLKLLFGKLSCRAVGSVRGSREPGQA